MQRLDDLKPAVFPRMVDSPAECAAHSQETLHRSSAMSTDRKMICKIRLLRADFPNHMLCMIPAKTRG